jgi:RNA polymerase sigma factor (sigma-70 family)
VWASFFADLPRHARLSDPDAFAAYLLAMARNKVAEAQRASAVGKRNLAQEKPLETITAGREDLLPGPHPTPSQIVGAEDEFQRMLRNRSDVQQRILTLLRDGGMTYREIADQLNTNEKTVRRLVRRLDPEAKEPCPPS